MLLPWMAGKKKERKKEKERSSMLVNNIKEKNTKENGVVLFLKSAH